MSNYYLKYQGLYLRLDIGQDNTTNEDELERNRKDNNGLYIHMQYQGGHEFKITADYWQSKDAQVEALIEFNPKSKRSAKGTYKYTKGEGHIGNLGAYELFWDEERKMMIVIYRHLYPRSTKFNPDNNRGWEVWMKE